MEVDFTWTDGSKATFLTWLKGKPTKKSAMVVRLDMFVCLFVRARIS